jgi:hypothetical protein
MTNPQDHHSTPASRKRPRINDTRRFGAPLGGGPVDNNDDNNTDDLFAPKPTAPPRHGKIDSYLVISFTPAPLCRG